MTTYHVVPGDTIIVDPAPVVPPPPPPPPPTAVTTVFPAGAQRFTVAPTATTAKPVAIQGYIWDGVMLKLGQLVTFSAPSSASADAYLDITGSSINGRYCRVTTGVWAGQLLSASVATFATDPLAPVTPPPPPPPGNPPADLQAAINATPSGGTLDATGGVYRGTFTINKPMTLKGGKISAPGNVQQLLVINAKNVTIDGTEIDGTGNTETFCYGVTLNSADGSVVKNCYIHDIIYCGVMVFGTAGGAVSSNHIARIGVGQANDTNAYGIAFTNNGGAGCSGMTADSNLIEDVPTWQGINTHSGINLTFSNNTVRRTRRAYWLAASSGYTISGCQVTNNRAESPLPVTYDPTAFFIASSTGCTFTGNFISNDYAHTGSEFHDGVRDYGNASTGLVVTGTTFG